MLSLVRREPFRGLVRWGPDLERWWNRGWVQPWPLTLLEAGMPVDMFETKDSYVAKVALPGAKPEDFEVSLVGNVLTIKAETKADEQCEENDYIYRECHYGKVERSVTVPDQVKAEDIKAEYERGVLTVTIPKAESRVAKTVKVTAK